ncbi:MAG: segregation/condensation protein A [Clostridium sp.]|nr:segregation/condensation protein A [Clostridium sp.]MCM1444206.1 segregation/condensation protein A [Candidatus Amulumruptor caecigallinarius]
MGYKVTIDKFEGPMDLLLHLIKESNIDICEIKIVEIIDQYLNYINDMESMNLDIASEYIVMAAELIEIKSSILLPKPVISDEDNEEDIKATFIEKLLDYKKYKEIAPVFKNLEEERKQIFTKEPSDLKNYDVTLEAKLSTDVTLDDLMNAIKIFLQNQIKSKPLNTTITTKEYSVSKRSNEIRDIIKKRKKVEFTELFDIISRDYVVVTFLSLLDLTKKQEVCLNQDSNFGKIFVSEKV